MGRLLAALAATVLAATAVLAATPATADPNCPTGCTVYQLTGEIVAAHATGQVALAAPNTPANGSALRLRALNTDRAFEQFLYDTATHELVLAGTNLCVTGQATTARITDCSAGVIYKSQAWAFTAGSWVNGYGRRLSVNSVTLGSPVLTSTTARATWAARPATS